MTPYRADLARVHHLGFAGHADACAEGVLGLLEPVRGGTVLEVGCGGGELTRHLLAAGHDVVATDGSPAMVELCRAGLPDAEVRLLRLPDDPVPPCDAVVGTGHLLNYLADLDAVHRALRSLARALRPGGVLALDVCDLRYGALRADAPPYVRVEPDWVIATRYERPAPDRFVRLITTFLPDDGRWRRDDEVHDTVLVDVAGLVAVLVEEGVRADVRPAFGSEALPEGLVVLSGRR